MDKTVNYIIEVNINKGVPRRDTSREVIVNITILKRDYC